MARTDEDLDDLIEHLASSTRLNLGEAQHLVAEVLNYFTESATEYVIRRHAELKRQELRNEEIFERIAAEMRTRRFTAPELTPRQIRRLIYG